LPDVMVIVWSDPACWLAMPARANALRITAALVLTPNVFCNWAISSAVRSSTSKLVTAIVSPVGWNCVETI